MCIGNLPSQIFANLYLADFDKILIRILGSEMRYIRYADDFIIMHPDKKVLMNTISTARDWLWRERKLRLHEHKITIQKINRGVRFTGYFIKGNVVHPGNTVRGNALNLCKEWALKNKHTDEERQKLMARYNSYSGLLKHSASYKIRCKMWRSLRDYDKITNYNNNKINIRK